MKKIIFVMHGLTKVVNEIRRIPIDNKKLLTDTFNIMNLDTTYKKLKVNTTLRNYRITLTEQQLKLQ